MDSLGLEMEMPVVRRDTGRSVAVTGLFEALKARKVAAGEAASLRWLNGRAIAVAAPPVYTSVDNAFNNLESSIGPIAVPDDGLRALQSVVEAELALVAACLAEEGMAVLNVAEHPHAMADRAFCEQVRAPKPIYRSWMVHRGWDHDAGIDAKAHNSPSTGVSAGNAVLALNTMLALAPALIALFANSPLEAGRLTGRKENRLTLWPRMFGTSRFDGDRWLSEMPDRPFEDLAHYLRWMFGPGTAMQAIPAALPGDYKTDGDLMTVDGDPPLLDFLRGGTKPARLLSSGAEVRAVPSLSQVEYLQFSNFLDARIRWAFVTPPPVEALLDALGRPGAVEDLFAQAARHLYIEGRAPGANFPDRDTLEDAGESAARSVLLAPSAVQLGLIRNLAEAWGVVERWGWTRLRRLRETAIVHGLDPTPEGHQVRDLCAEVLAAAERGLSADERSFLAFPAHVLATGRTGADRLIALWQSTPGGTSDKLAVMAERRGVMLAPDAGVAPVTPADRVAKAM